MMHLRAIISHIAARHLSKRARAIRELQRITEAKRNSFEIIDYRKRRNAALKHTRQMGT